MLAQADLEAIPMLNRRRPGPTGRAMPPGVPILEDGLSEVTAREVALMLAIAGGDLGDAMRDLYSRYARRLHGLGLRLLGDPSLAEELVQETFIRVWRTADRFDPERGSPGTFIYTIARRLVIDLWRRPSSRPFQSEPKDQTAPGDEFDQMLTSLAVRDVLDTLSQAHRQVLELSYQRDLTQVEIAARIGLSVGTVKSRTYHALRSFRRALVAHGLNG